MQLFWMCLNTVTDALVELQHSNQKLLIVRAENRQLLFSRLRLEMGFLTLPCELRARSRQPGLISILLPTTSTGSEAITETAFLVLCCDSRQAQTVKTFSQNCFIFTPKKLFHLTSNFSILSTLKKDLTGTSFFWKCPTQYTPVFFLCLQRSRSSLLIPPCFL